MARQPLSERIGAWLGLDDDWRRPGPRRGAGGVREWARLNSSERRGYVFRGWWG